MINVIRAQLYQLKRDIVVWGILLFALLISFIMHIESFEKALTGSEAATLMGESMSVMVGMLVIMVVVANVMGKDFLDKTINYEVLSGHTRKDVFLGRLLVGTTTGVLLAFIVTLAIPVTLTILNGWGTTMELNGFLIRCGLYLLILIRIACELAFLTTIAKNPYITYLVAFVLGEVQMGLTTAQIHYADAEVSPVLPVANSMNLFMFQDWSTFFLDETDQIVYNSAVTSEMAVWAIVPSIVIGLVMVIFTYVFFRQDDLN